MELTTIERPQNSRLSAGDIMKLLFCRRCGDLFKLRYEAKSCECGEVWGAYKDDGDRAWIEGSSAFLFCIGNWSLSNVVGGGMHDTPIFAYDVNNGKIEVLP